MLMTFKLLEHSKQSKLPLDNPKDSWRNWGCILTKLLHLFILKLKVCLPLGKKKKNLSIKSIKWPPISQIHLRYCAVYFRRGKKESKQIEGCGQFSLLNCKIDYLKKKKRISSCLLNMAGNPSSFWNPFHHMASCW